MKKKVFLVLIGIIVIIVVICLTYEIQNNRNLKPSSNSRGMFAIYLEKEKNTSNYEESSSSKWPQGGEYAINMKKTHCENGSILRWNMETKKMKVITQGSDKCYVYFDLAEYGTEDHPYLIQTIEDLVRLSKDVNGGKTYAGKYFLLTNDLDFNDPIDYEDSESTSFGDINGINGNEPLIKELTTGSGFVPIGNTSATPFDGNFDGWNKRIDNLYINNNVKENIDIGFFGSIKNSNIENLTLFGSIFDLNNKNTGGFIGGTLGVNVGINLKNYISITHEELSSNTNTGGIIGKNSGKTTLINCSNFGNITGNNATGGLVGISNSDLIIENSYNQGNITGREASGGLIGNTYSANIFINKSYNQGAVYCNRYSSGLIGFFYSTTNNDYNAYILNSYNIGYIESNMNGISGTYGAQGLLLVQNGNIYILNSYNQGKNISFDIDSRGLIWGYDNELIKMYNIYNSSDEKYGIGTFCTPNNDTIENVYYIERENVVGSNANFGTPITKDIMQSQAFVDTLNKNIEDINLSEIDESLKAYTLSKWKLGPDGYPTLINE